RNNENALKTIALAYLIRLILSFHDAQMPGFEDLCCGPEEELALHTKRYSRTFISIARLLMLRYMCIELRCLSSITKALLFCSAESKAVLLRQSMQMIYEIICSFFAQQPSMPETHDDEDLLQIDDDAMEELTRGFLLFVEYSSSEESNNSSGDETLTGLLYENFKREKAYKAVPLPTGIIIPPRADVAFTDELAIRNKVINSESSGTDQVSCESKNKEDLIKNKEQTHNTVKSNTDRNKVIIKDWVDSDDEEIPLGFLVGLMYSNILNLSLVKDITTLNKSKIITVKH
ncbi:hypothetical protein Tco_1372317, partial [Tanacetum coccineum]